MAEETKQGKTKTNEAAKDMHGMLAQFEATLDEYMVKKAPFHIPTGGKEFLVKVSPYVVLVVAILTIPAIVVGLGLTAILSPFAMMGGYYHYGALGLISGALSLAALVIELMAVNGLFKRTHAAWHLLFYASLIMFVGNLLSFNVINGIIGSLIGWYILFQIKELYKK